MKKIGIILFVLLIISLVASITTVRYFIKENSRLKSNQTTLLSENNMLEDKIKQYKFRDSLNAISIQALELSVSEIKNSLPEIRKTIKDLGIPIRRVETITTSLLTAESNIITPVRDTIIKKDTTYIPALAFDHKSKYQQIHGVIVMEQNKPKVASIDITTKVPIGQILHRVPKFEFWFIRIGTKHLSQEMWSDNPDVVIDYSRVIKVKK